MWYRFLNYLSDLQVGKFLRWVRHHYHEPIEGTPYVVKFYAQCNTFSYELHDSNEICFTNESKVFSSGVLSYWTSCPDAIKRDILYHANNLCKDKIIKITGVTI